MAETITKLLVKIATESKRTLVISLHAVELARRYFPRVVGLRGGTVSFDVSSDNLDREMLEDVFVDATSNVKETLRLDGHISRQLHAC